MLRAICSVMERENLLFIFIIKVYAVFHLSGFLDRSSRINGTIRCKRCRRAQREQALSMVIYGHWEYMTTSRRIKGKRPPIGVTPQWHKKDGQRQRSGCGYSVEMVLAHLVRYLPAVNLRIGSITSHLFDPAGKAGELQIPRCQEIAKVHDDFSLSI